MLQYNVLSDGVLLGTFLDLNIARQFVKDYGAGSIFQNHVTNHTGRLEYRYYIDNNNFIALADMCDFPTIGAENET